MKVSCFYIDQKRSFDKLTLKVELALRTVPGKGKDEILLLQVFSFKFGIWQTFPLTYQLEHWNNKNFPLYQLIISGIFTLVSFHKEQKQLQNFLYFW